MQTVILGGGLATRLRPLTTHTPKSMIPVAGKPFLEHQLALLRHAGLREVVLCVGYLGEQIEQYFGDGSRFGMRLSYSWEDERLLGTGGALKKAAPLLAEEFFVMYGDAYLMLDYQDIARTFRAGSFPAMMVVYRNEGLYDRSNVVVRNNQVVLYSKKEQTPETLYIDEGISALHRRSLDLLTDGESADLEELFQNFIATGELYAYETDQRFYEIGSTRGLEELEALIVSGEIPSPISNSMEQKP